MGGFYYKHAIILGVALLIASCGLSREQIADTAQASIQETLRTNDQLADKNLIVESVRVFKVNDSSYKGIAIVSYKGTSHDVPIDITVDGKQVLWTAQPGAFMFVVQEDLKGLFR